MTYPFRALFCSFVFVSLCCGSTKQVEGFAGGWQHHQPTTEWSKQPITSYVDDADGFYIVVGTDRKIRGYLRLDQLSAVLDSLKLAQTLTADRAENSKVLGEFANDADVKGEKTGVRLTFVPANPGDQPQVTLLVKDFHDRAAMTLTLMPDQIEPFITLLQGVPTTIATLKSQPLPKTESHWMEWALGTLSIAAAVGLVIQKYRHCAFVERQDAMVTAKDATIAEKDVSIAVLIEEKEKLADQIAESKQALEKAEKTYESQVNAIRVACENAAHARDVSERELVKAFVELIAIRQLDRDNPSATTGVHDLSQTQERALGDLLAHDRNRFLLIEFKRDLSQFGLEVTKKGPVRRPQITKIQSSAQTTAVSVKCHFGAWGVLGGYAAIEFAPYLNAWLAFDAHEKLSSVTPLNKFIDGFLPEMEADALYGVPAPQFRAYVKLLEENAPASGSNSATCPLLLVVRSADGMPQFLKFPSMMMLLQIVQQIEQRLEQDMKLAQEQAKKLTSKQGKGFGRGISGNRPSQSNEYRGPEPEPEL